MTKAQIVQTLKALGWSGMVSSIDGRGVVALDEWEPYSGEDAPLVEYHITPEGRIVDGDPFTDGRRMVRLSLVEWTPARDGQRLPLAFVAKTCPDWDDSDMRALDGDCGPGRGRL